MDKDGMTTPEDPQLITDNATIDVEDFIQGTLGQMAEYLVEMVVTHGKETPINKVYHYNGLMSVQIPFERYETPEEALERVKLEGRKAARLARKEAKDREVYEKLKARFG